MDNKSAYYCMYYSLYSMFMKIGIKSEIHSCSIEFAKKYLNKYFDNELEWLDSCFRLRIKTQYYIDWEISESDIDGIKNKASLFMVKCKEILQTLTNDEIQNIRKNFK